MKKIIAGILAVALCLGLVGCAGGTESSDQTPSKSSTASSAKEQKVSLPREGGVAVIVYKY